jgi:hypothetical protein
MNAIGVDGGYNIASATTKGTVDRRFSASMIAAA